MSLNGMECLVHITTWWVAGSAVHWVNLHQIKKKVDRKDLASSSWFRSFLGNWRSWSNAAKVFRTSSHIHKWRETQGFAKCWKVCGSHNISFTYVFSKIMVKIWSEFLPALYTPALKLFDGFATRSDLNDYVNDPGSNVSVVKRRWCLDTWV